MMNQTMNHLHGSSKEYSINDNNDAMVEILCCLPLKSLTRFKTVNKTWYRNISSRYFASRYRDKKDNPWGLLIQQRNASGSNKSWLSIYSSEHCNGVLSPVRGGFGELIRRYFKHAPPRIVGPLDGLICIYEDVPLSNPWGKTIALCNPYLGGKVEIVPPLPLSPSAPSSTSAGCNLGLGYDSLTRDYKIVMVFSYITNNNNNSLHVIEVYSRATNSWKELDRNVLSGDISIIRPITPYQDGSFAHWHAWERSTGLYDWVVLSFDMRNEVFKVTPLPPCFPGVQRVRATTASEVEKYSLGISIHSKEDSLALDRKSCSNKRWFIDRWKSKKLGGGIGDECWVPLIPRVEVHLSPWEAIDMVKIHGVVSQCDWMDIKRAVKLHCLTPQGTLVTIPTPQDYYYPRANCGFLYEPSLIELKDDPINYSVRSLSGAVCDVGLVIAATGVAVRSAAAAFGAAANRCP